MTAWAAVALLLAAPLVAVTGLVALLLGGVVWLLRRSGSRQLSSRRSGRGGALPLVMAATTLALLALVLQRGLRTVGPVVDLANQGASVDLRAEVTSDPRLLPVSGTRRTALVIVTLQARHVVGRGAESHVNAPVLAFAPQSWLTLQWGEEVEVRGRLGPPRQGDDVVATLTGKGPPVTRAPPSPVQRAAGRLRSGLRSAVAGTPSDGAGLLPGLVVGDTSGLDPGLEQAMRSSGLTHLVAVSGSNVGN